MFMVAGEILNLLLRRASDDLFSWMKIRSCRDIVAAVS